MTSANHRRVLIAICVAVLSMATTGCRGRLARLVRSRIAATTGCPSDVVRAERVEGPLWRVSGCGMTVTEYLCWSSPGVGYDCRPAPAPARASSFTSGGRAREPRRLDSEAPPPVRISVSVPPPTAPTQRATQLAPVPSAQDRPAPSEWSPQLADRLFRSVADHVRACVPSPLALTIELGRDGRVSSVSGMESLSVDQQVCVAAAFQRIRVRGGLTRTGRASFEFR